MLDELIELTIIDGQDKRSFKVKAYQKARNALEDFPRDFTKLSEKELIEISGVGKSTANQILEFKLTGTTKKLDELREKYPHEYVMLTRISGLGPKTVNLLNTELNISNIDQLLDAIENQKVRTLPRLGIKAETKMLQTLEKLRLNKAEKMFPIADAFQIAESLVQDWERITSISNISYCGDLRRMKEQVGEIKIVIETSDIDTTKSNIGDHPELNFDSENGNQITFLSIKKIPVIVEFYPVGQYHFGTFFHTGSDLHIKKIKERTKDLGFNFKRSGLQEKNKTLEFNSEKEIYKKIGLQYVEPEMREAQGEVDLSLEGQLPDVVSINDIKGDLHYHTDRSGDGRSSLNEMAAAAESKGYEYIAFTDHGEDLKINGSTREQMLEHKDNINNLQVQYPNMKLLFGCELNIDANGNLDYDKDFREIFDYTVASVHSHFDLSQEEQTMRIVKAVSDPTVNSIGHLTGRYIGKRPGIDLNIEILLEALLKFDKALEINGSLQRLDASSEIAKQAMSKGVKLVINTDSHHVSDLQRMEFGVSTAKRGWVNKELVINTWPYQKFITWLNNK